MSIRQLAPDEGALFVSSSWSAQFTASRSVSDFEWLSGECPAIRLGHRFVEVINEVPESLTQFVDRFEVAAFDDSTNNHAEPDFYLVQP